MTNTDTHEKINNIDSFIIPHASIKKAISIIQNAIEASKTSREPKNVLLVGDSGTGKTTICEAIVNSFASETIIEDHCEIRTVPAFYASVPKPATVKSVAVSILQSLGSIALHGETQKITERIGELLKTCKTQVILLDEIHHLINKGSSNSSEIRDWLKSLINSFHVPIVTVGTPICNELIYGDKQTARRFRKKVQLSNFKSPYRSKEFSKFLYSVYKGIEKKSDIYISKELNLKKSILSMFAATGGNPSDIVYLIKEASEISLNEKKSEVDLNCFKIAYDENVLVYTLCTSLNPFDCTEVQLQKIIRKS